MTREEIIKKLEEIHILGLVGDFITEKDIEEYRKRVTKKFDDLADYILSHFICVDGYEKWEGRTSKWGYLVDGDNCSHVNSILIEHKDKQAILLIEDK